MKIIDEHSKCIIYRQNNFSSQTEMLKFLLEKKNESTIMSGKFESSCGFPDIDRGNVK